MLTILLLVAAASSCLSAAIFFSMGAYDSLTWLLFDILGGSRPKLDEVVEFAWRAALTAGCLTCAAQTLIRCLHL